MNLVADVGGTKTVFASVSGEPGGILLSSVKRYENAEFVSFKDALDAYIQEVSFGPVQTLVVAAAGIVAGNICQLTNINWTVDGPALEADGHIGRVFIINDLMAAAYGVNCLGEDSLETVHSGIPQEDANQIVVSPGTGLGESIIHFVDGNPVPIAGEGGHVDFAPFDGLTHRLWEYTRRLRPRVSVEDILSGPGLFAIYSFLAYEAAGEIDEAIILSAHPGGIIVDRGLGASDPLAVKTLEVFLDVLAAEAGNVALKVLPAGGVFIGGGIIPRLLPILDCERFARLFADKGAHRKILEAYPIHIIIDTEAPLYGAGEFALSRING
ncbi:MAG: glucokinase [Candidatus Zixiibacteriota bacterium]